MNDKQIDELIGKALQEDKKLPEGLSELRFGDRERIEKANHVAVHAAAQEQQPFVQRAFLHLSGEFWRGLPGLRIVELHRHHRALRTNVGNIRAAILRFM